MTTLHALILGIVEGITEFLPISSTGHLILASKLLRLEQTEFVKSFEIAIQLGAIFSVVWLYWRSVFLSWNIAKKVLIAFLPTGVIGLFLYKIVKTFLLGETVVVWSLLIGGIALIMFELFSKPTQTEADDLQKISYKQAFTVGLFQSLAIIPGVSRAAATIVGGLLMGIERKTIVEFSFLLAIPTMTAATGLDLVKNATSFNADQIGALFIGFLTSFIVAIFTIKFLLKFIKTHTFIPFGIYRIAVAVIFLILSVL